MSFIGYPYMYCKSSHSMSDIFSFSLWYLLMNRSSFSVVKSVVHGLCFCHLFEVIEIFSYVPFFIFKIFFYFCLNSRQVCNLFLLGHFFSLYFMWLVSDSSTIYWVVHLPLPQPPVVLLVSYIRLSYMHGIVGSHLSFQII